MPTQPDSPTSLGSSFASLSLSPSSGVGFPSPSLSEDETVAEQDDEDDDSSDDEFIVLRRSESGTGSGGPLRAGLAASVSSLVGSSPLAAEDESTGAETPRVADARELKKQHDTARRDQSDDDDNKQEGSRPIRWADEYEDELGTGGRPSTSSHLGQESPAAAADDGTPRPSSSPSCGSGSGHRRSPTPRRRPKAQVGASCSAGKSTRSSRRSSEPDGAPSSVLCTDDSASAVLDLFFDDGNAFGGAGPGGGGQLGKLRFWQSLIVELGILPAPNAAWSDLSSFGSSSSSSSSSAASYRTATTSTTAPAFPTTLTAAARLLRAEAHVNLVDYLALRARVAYAADDGERAELRARLKGLRKSSRTALRWYTRRSHKFAKKKLVKRQWLSPLLIDVL